MTRTLNKHWADLDPEAVYVGRGSHFGNPFPIGTEFGDRDEVIERYKIHLFGMVITGKLILTDFLPLRDKDLICYCAPKACHADFLREVVLSFESLFDEEAA